jgi:hypothetical protein
MARYMKQRKFNTESTSLYKVLFSIGLCRVVHHRRYCSLLVDTSGVVQHTSGHFSQRFNGNAHKYII